MATLAPTLYYRDAPEFVNTAFALGISHPAGFPAYNLLAKAVTFAPLGSVAFRINLFSAVCAVLTLILLYRACALFLEVLVPEARESAWASWVPVVCTGLLAVSPPFWKQSIVAEVYTLHTAFTAGLFYLFLKWKIQNDVRYLYGAALLFGLSSGNHATVGFYLPAVIVLFFMWCRERKAVHLSRCILLFLVGFSVYTYLPVRSMQEPSFDWGNPETVEGFLFQVTDRKDASRHFEVVRSGRPQMGSGGGDASPGNLERIGSAISQGASNAVPIAVNLARDVMRDLSAVGLAGFLGGGILCLARSRAFFFFLAIIAGGNILFFFGWRNESYLPTYLVALLCTAPALGWFFLKLETVLGQKSDSRYTAPGCAVALILFWTFWQGTQQAPRIDRSEDYIPEMMPKNLYLSLDNYALFIPAISWFHYYYHQDVQRLRDDVTAVNVWDLLSPEPPAQITPRRYPDLLLPGPGAYDFRSKESIAAYARDLMDRNQDRYPILMEANQTFFEQTLWAQDMTPHRNVFLKYAPGETEDSGCQQWQDFMGILEEDLQRPGAGRDLDWVNVPKFLATSWALYAQDTGRYAVEAEALRFLRQTFGFFAPHWQRRWIENRLYTGHLQEARQTLTELGEKAPRHWETFMARGAVLKMEGNLPAALEAYEEAARLRSGAFAPQRELVRVYSLLGRTREAEAALQEGRKRMRHLRHFQQLKDAAEGKTRQLPAETISCFGHNPLS